MGEPQLRLGQLLFELLNRVRLIRHRERPKQFSTLPCEERVAPPLDDIPRQRPQRRRGDRSCLLLVEESERAPDGVVQLAGELAFERVLDCR